MLSNLLSSYYFRHKRIPVDPIVLYPIKVVFNNKSCKYVKYFSTVIEKVQFIHFRAIQMQLNAI